MKKLKVTLLAVVLSCAVMVIVVLFMETPTDIPISSLVHIYHPEVELGIYMELHTHGKLRVATIFDHHMVLQREPYNPKIWGWCDEMDFECRLKITLSGVEYKVRGQVLPLQVWATEEYLQRKWTLELPPMPPGGPHLITIEDSFGNSLMIEDVYFGDVYICAGQSNMLFSTGQTFAERTKEEEGDDFDYKLIRHFTLGRNDVPSQNLDTYPAELSWTVASSDTIRIAGNPWTHFSAVCWYFGKPLHKEVGIPLGLVALAVNGSPLQTWVSPNTSELCGVEHNEEVECCPTRDNAVWYGMVEPVIEISTRGVVFYQGESNLFGQPYYLCAFPDFVREWRETANDPTLPFYTIEIAPVFYRHEYTQNFRFLQQELADTIDGVSLINTIDLGDYDSPFGFLHPRYKEEIGRRVYRQVLLDIYGYDLHVTVPIVESVTITPRTTFIEVNISYERDSVANGLVIIPFECPTGDFQLQRDPMEIFCADFVVELMDGTMLYNTNPTLDGTKNIVLEVPYDDPSVPIRSVLYGYCGWPKAILYNSAGLPARAFNYTIV